MKYRREIDGVRAIAVLSVILFHAGFLPFGGGFVGVDVFFVISGYLITSLIVNDIRLGRFSLVNFYARRARRILPALFFVLLFCLSFSWFWLLPADFYRFSRSAFATSLSFSNVYFRNESGYFDGASELKPLLHTWSISLEEQFYLIYPLLLLAFRGARSATLKPVVIVLIFISLWLAQSYVARLPAATYFLLPSRFWELAMGGVIAIFGVENNIGRCDIRLRQFTSVLGVSLIFISVFLFNKSTPFPSLWTLVPVVGTVLLICFADSSTGVGRILSSKPAVSLGLISYSAYLWHQPIFAFARYRFFVEQGSFDILILSAVSMIFGYVSWKYIEKPFRFGWKAMPNKAILAVASCTCVLFAVLVFSMDNKSFFESRLESDERLVYSFIDHGNSPSLVESWRAGVCFIDSKSDSFDFYNKNLCLKKDPHKKNFLLLGDSHAAHLLPAFIELFPDVNFLQATASGCLPLLHPKGQRRCVEMLDYVYKEIIPKSELDGVIISGRWDSNEIEETIQTTRFLEKHVGRVFLIGPVFEFKKPYPLIYLYKNNAKEKIDILDSSIVSLDRLKLNNLMRDLYFGERTSYIDIYSSIGADRDFDPILEGKYPIIFDTAHLTQQGARYVLQILKRRGFNL